MDLTSPITQRAFTALAGGLPALLCAGCTAPAPGESRRATEQTASDGPASQQETTGYEFTQGSQEDRGFVVDNSLRTPAGRTLHFSMRLPEDYDAAQAWPLYIACPGWEGLYFQGVGANLQEDYPFEALNYISNLIIISPQLDDWGEQSARDVIELTEWAMSAYAVDASRIYLSGCSGGGETISIVMGLLPELYRRALHTISRWNGDVDVLAASMAPVYLAIGENDDYYGSAPARNAYQLICDAHRRRGHSEEEISECVVLDVKPTSYFTERGFSADASQHGAGGYLFAHDEQVMGWLFSD